MKRRFSRLLFTALILCVVGVAYAATTGDTAAGTAADNNDGNTAWVNTGNAVNGLNENDYTSVTLTPVDL